LITQRYSITIAAPRETVWRTMLDQDTYRQWTRAFSPNSQYVGEWTEGSHILFVDPGRGGMKALLETVRPYERVEARHIAVLGPDGAEDDSSDEARRWTGCRECYSFTVTEGGTRLDVEVDLDERYRSSFDEMWPQALQSLRALCEAPSGG